jgi:hypothetical protein
LYEFRKPYREVEKCTQKKSARKEEQRPDTLQGAIIDEIDYLQFGEDEFSRSFSADIQTLFKKCINDLPKTSHLKYIEKILRTM